ncbi:MAG: hypothetical protein ACR2HG_04050 [Pyrinomonadaceae bacterium]
MYRRPKFLEILLEIRQEMSREADYDVDLFAEMIRSGKFKDNSAIKSRELKNGTASADDRKPPTDD